MQSEDYQNLIDGHIAELREAVEQGQKVKAKSEADMIRNLCQMWQSDEET
jgi:hypothetical protein